MTPPEPSGFWRLARPAAFALDAETAHHLTLALLAAVDPVLPAAPGPSDVSRHPSLATESMGLSFPNPIGLAAGLDKNATAVCAWQRLGFGFLEVGTVTAHPQPGNPRPRLFRLPRDGAVMNRMGFNNDGAEVVGQRLARLRDRGRVRVPLGVNIGKSKVTPNEEAASDYRKSFDATAKYADFVVVNVSSPNTPGLRDLQQADELRRLLDAVGDRNQKLESPRPVLLKLAPDLDDESVLACTEVASSTGCRGVIVSNTTIARDGLQGPVPEGSGGISGAPLYTRSTALLRIVADAHAGKLGIVGVGGVMDPETMFGKLDAGADLVEVYTGLIYGGPGFVRRLLRALVERRAAEGQAAGV